MSDIKVIYLVDQELTQRDVMRYGIYEFSHEGVELEVWDCFGIINNKPSDLEFHSIENIKVVAVNDSHDISCNIKKNRKNFFIDLLLRPMAVPLFMGIKSNGGRIVRHKGVQPFSNWKPSFFQRIRFFFVKYKNSKNKLYVIKKIVNRILRLRFDLGVSVDKTSELVDVWMCAGRISADNIVFGKDSHILWTHHYDYDVYLLHGKEADDKGYVLYLDNADFYHPDINLLDYKPQLSFDRFSKSIGKFLSHLSNELNYRVIVAGHPRVKYEHLSKIYSSFEVIQNKTAELVKNSSLVVAMDSTAINYAVLWNKPLIIITTAECQSNNFYNISAIEQALNVQSVNIDHKYDSINFKEYSELSKKCYSVYIDRFIKKNGGTKKTRWNILLDYLNGVSC